VLGDQVPATRSGQHRRGTIQLPNGYIGATELAVVGDDVVVMGGAPDNFAIFSRGGEQVATVPIQRWLTVNGPPRLLDAGPGQAAGANKELDIFGASGKIVSTGPPALDLPIGQFGDIDQFEGNANPQTFATDWHGTVWYALGTYIVEVRTT